MARVVVISGGLAGCSAALALAELGWSVVLVEKRAELGGRASSYLARGWDKPLDNCQHVLMGCCVNLLDLYRRIGALREIEWYDSVPLIAPDGSRGGFRAWPLPPPLHLAPALAGMPGLSLGDRLALAASFGRMMLAGRRLERLDGETFAHWLRPSSTRALDRTFWRLMIASVLNVEPDQASAAYGAFFFLDGLMRHRQAFRLGVPRVPLSALHHGRMSAALAGAGVEVRTRTLARASFARGRATGAELRGERVEADAVVVATHWRQLGGVLPRAAARAVGGGAPDVLAPSPLTGIHLGYDVPVLDEPVLGFLDSDLDWLMTFDGGRHLSLTVSASRTWSGLSHDVRVQRAMAALRRYFPHLPEPARTASCHEGRATFCPGPGCDVSRPGSATRIPGLFLAGCWTGTGWPSTMEGAVRSGYRAAEAVAAAAGRSDRFVVPDLPRGGLMRLVRPG